MFCLQTFDYQVQLILDRYLNAHQTEESTILTTFTIQLRTLFFCRVDSCFTPRGSCVRNRTETSVYFFSLPFLIISFGLDCYVVSFTVSFTLNIF